MVGLLRALLLAEAAGGLVLSIFLTMAASLTAQTRRRMPTVPIRFAAAGALMLGILAAIASRGARRRRSWSWTLAAMLQVIIAVATGIAIFTSSGTRSTSSVRGGRAGHAGPVDGIGASSARPGLAGRSAVRYLTGSVRFPA